MSNRIYRVGSGAMLASCWVALLAYGCVAAPAENSPGDGGGNASGMGVTGGTASGGGAGVGMGGSLPTGGATPTGGTGVTGGVPSGGAAGAGVTGGVPSGGAAGAGVTGGAPTGGVAGAGVTGGAGGAPGGSGGTAGGSTAGANGDAECKGIRSNMACPIEGKACPNMACGLGDMGRRDCNCATNWTCSSCSHVGTPIATKPATADTACSGVMVGVVCAVSPDAPESVCNPNMTAGNTIMEEYCMCASNPTAPSDPPEWNCDDGPSSW